MADVGEPLREALRPPGPVQFNVTDASHGDVAIVRVEGELDVLTTPKLAAHLTKVTRSSTGNLVLDLSDALFIDSAGLAMLLSVRRRLARKRRSLTVLCDHGPVRRTIEMARLDETLGLTPSSPGKMPLKIE